MQKPQFYAALYLLLDPQVYFCCIAGQVCLVFLFFFFFFLFQLKKKKAPNQKKKNAPH